MNMPGKKYFKINHTFC